MSYCIHTHNASGWFFVLFFWVVWMKVRSYFSGIILPVYSLELIMHPLRLNPSLFSCTDPSNTPSLSLFLTSSPLSNPGLINERAHGLLTSKTERRVGRRIWTSASTFWQFEQWAGGRREKINTFHPPLCLTFHLNTGCLLALKLTP